MRQTDTGLLVETTRPSTLPKKVIYILVRARTSPKIVRWTFLLFASTFPIEAIDLDAIRGVASLTRLVGLLFFGICLLYPKVCFRRPPRAVWWFAGYVSVYVLRGLFIPEHLVGPFIEQLQTFIQLLVLCWIGSTLLQEEKFTRHTFLTFSIATLLPAAGMLLGLPGFSKDAGGGRLSIGGFGVNGLALIMALGAQGLIGFGIEQTHRNIWMRVTFMAMSLFPLTAMVYTGSRGGIIACVTGVTLYALPYRRSKRKMIAILGATIAVVGVVYIAVSDQSVWSRFEMSYESGDTAGRDKLFAVSIEMISEKPLLGWQPIVFYHELGLREGKGYARRGRDAHNIILHLLLEVGLLGAAPFLIGLGLCMRAAWTARVGSLGLLPLVWFATMLVGSMTLSLLRYKALWFVLMLSLASGASTVKQFKRKNLMIRSKLQYSHKRNMNHGLDHGGGPPAPAVRGQNTSAPEERGV